MPAEAMSSFCPGCSSALAAFTQAHLLGCPGPFSGQRDVAQGITCQVPRDCRKVCLLPLPTARLRSTFHSAPGPLSRALTRQGQPLGMEWRFLLKWSAVAVLPCGYRVCLSSRGLAVKALHDRTVLSWVKKG